MGTCKMALASIRFTVALACVLPLVIAANAPVGRLSQATATNLSEELNAEYAVPIGGLHRLFEPVLLPPFDLSNTTSVDDWNQHALGDSWGILVREGSSESAVKIGYITRMHSDKRNVNQELQLEFTTTIPDKDVSHQWRTMFSFAYTSIINHKAAVVDRPGMLLLLRHLILNPYWPPASAHELRDFGAFVNGAFGDKSTLGLKERGEAQSTLFEIMQAHLENHTYIPPNFLHLCTELVTLTATIKGPDDVARRLRAQTLLEYAVREHIETSKQPLDLDLTRTFISLAGFHSSRDTSSGIAACSSSFMEAIVGALLNRQGGYAILMDYFQELAVELGRPNPPTTTLHSIRHEGTSTGQFLEKNLVATYTSIARDNVFRLFIRGDTGANERMSLLAPPLAKLLLSSDLEVWNATLDLIVNTPTAPDLFSRVISDPILWDDNQHDVHLVCRLGPNRMGKLFRAILRLHRIEGIHRHTTFAVAAYKSLTNELRKHNAVHSLLRLLRVDRAEEPIDPSYLRRAMQSPGMPYPFLASNNVPISVAFAEGLPDMFSLLNAASKDINISAASIGLDFTSASAQEAKGSGQPTLTAMMLGVLAESLENPVHDHNKLAVAVRKLITEMVRAPELGLEILMQIGSIAPAGRTAAGKLTPLDDWVNITVLPSFNRTIQLVLSLYPQEPNTLADYVTPVVNQRVTDVDGRLRSAVAAFTAYELMFHRPSDENGDAQSDLGPDVATLVESTLHTLTQALLTSGASASLREPAASDTLIHRLQALGNFMRAMRYFTKANMIQLSMRRIPSLRKVLFLLRSLYPKYWHHTDINPLSSTWSQAELLDLGVFIRTAHGVIDFNVDHLFQYDGSSTELQDPYEVLNSVIDAQPVRGKELRQLVEEHARVHLAQALSVLCLRDMKDVLVGVKSIVELEGISFQSLAERQLDRLIFSTSDYTTSFEKYNAPALASMLANGKHLFIHPEALESLGKNVVDRYAAEFASMSAPISFLLPNQLIALTIANQSHATDVLLLLGTGQGKSIVLAQTAIYALRPLPGAPNAPPNLRVFVLTTYDHLAKRDHGYASRLFSREGIKSCAITADSASLACFADAEVVYLNAVSLSTLLQTVMLKALIGSSELTAGEIDLLKTFYGVKSSPYVLIMDEFDLILDDIPNESIFVHKIPPSFLSRADVEKHRTVNAELGNIEPFYIDPKHKSTVQWNRDHGEKSTQVQILTTVRHGLFNSGETFYHLTPSVFRASAFFAGARNIFGASGSANDDEVYILPGRNNNKAITLLAMPYSHEPTQFTTRILPLDFANHSPIVSGTNATLDGAAGIWCQNRRVIGDGLTADITEAEVEELAHLIVSDILLTYSLSTGSLKSPVLLFLPTPDAMYTINTPSGIVKKPIRDFVITKLKSAFSESAVNVAPLDGDLSDHEIQRIGDPGVITVAHNKLGRGIDIRPSVDTPGLHVIVATEVSQLRLLKQMIGRTGRLGRDGSYSILVLHRILSRPTAASEGHIWKAAMHHVSALAATRLLSPDFATMTVAERKAWSQQWLVFLFGCIARGTRDPTVWPLNDVNYEQLRKLVPVNDATRLIYSHLDDLKEVAANAASGAQ